MFEINFITAGFFLYLLIVLAVGFLSYRSNKSHKDYFLGDRKLNHWVVAFSERASGESAWLLLGLPGAALAVGFLEVWTALGCILGIIFYWYVIAKNLRVETEKYKSITLPDFFAARFDANDRALRFLSMIIIIFYFAIYLAAQFKGAGNIFNVTFKIEPEYGMMIGAAVIIFYTMMGGFFAVAWTDLVQGIIMIGTLVVLPVAGLLELNSQGISLFSAVESAGPEFLSTVGGKTGWAAAAIVISGLSWGFGYMGQPHLLTRFMAIKDPGQIAKSRRIAIAWAIPAFIGAMLIGLIGLSLYGQNFFSNTEHVMPYLAEAILPAWIAGIFISGAVAAMMSTADSQLLVISSSVIEDFYHKGLKKEVSQAKLLTLSRLITVSVGVIGFFIAYYSSDNIFGLVSLAWAGLGASFGPALLLILKWKNITKTGVLAGMISGSLGTVLWSYIGNLNELINARFASFALAFLVIIIVSKMGSKTEA